MGTWTTPTAIHSRCGYTTFEASLSIDDDEATYWTHAVNALHWVKYDMGQTYTVTKVRVMPRNYDFTSFDVYVSDDPDSWGSAVATGCTATKDIWNEINCTSKDGRYVYLKDIDTAHVNNGVYLYEFDAYSSTGYVPASHPSGRGGGINESMQGGLGR